MLMHLLAGAAAIAAGLATMNLAAGMMYNIGNGPED